MGNAHWIIDFITSPATPLYFVALIYGIRSWKGAPPLILAFVEWRKTTLAAREADWRRLRDEVQRQGDELREIRINEKDCQHKLINALGRIATLEGYNDGRGEAHQEAQRIVSAERQADAKKERPR